MKRIQHDIRLGYPDSPDCGLNERAIVTVTAEKIVLKPERGASVILSPDEVVGFKIDGWLRFFTQVIVVEHVAFDKIGSIFLDPVGITCRRLIAEIAQVGFHPKAKPGVPWEPGHPFPFEESEDEDTQQIVAERRGIPPT